MLFDQDAEVQYDAETTAIMKANEELLSLFAADIDHLAPKTRKTHLENIDFYINSYLLHYEPLDFTYGIQKIESFMEDFFIHKCIWSSPSAMRSMAASIKKFYHSMMVHEKIKPSDYDYLCATIKENMEFWLSECKAEWV